MDSHLTEGPEGEKATRSDTRLYARETEFLQDRVRGLQAHLQEQLTDLEVSTNEDSLPKGQFELLATRQRLGRVLRELLQTPERDRHPLETILEERLRQVHQRFGAMEHTVEDMKAYDEAFWGLEHERAILDEILADWERWSRDADMKQGEATDSWA